MFRLARLLISLVLLLVLAGVADRAAAHVAESRVASAIQDAENLQTEPDVTIHGVPFLTQLVRGVYGDVGVRVTDLSRAGVRFAVIDVRLHEAHVPFGDVIRSDVKRIPVDRVDGTALMTYAELDRLVGHGVHYSYAGNGAIRVAAAGGVVAAETAPHLHGRDLTVLRTAVGSVSVRLPALPFHLALTSVDATADGVRVAVSAQHVVIDVASG